ncbi:MAG: hypothetical protein QG635_2411 [Bacteroidota bacterium]|nr:hypothetical protein [Bacteroidota bacterium]
MKQSIIILFLSMSFVLLSCSDSGSPVSLGGNQVKLVEPAKLKEAVKNVEDALLQGDAVKLKSMMLPKYLPQYESAIDGNGSKLVGFGEIFKTRKLIALDKIYAVYQVAYNGSYYEITFGWDDEGNWKLMNF